AAGFLDAQSASVASAARQKAAEKRRRSYGHAAGIHGHSRGRSRSRSSIGSVSAVLYKSFRERFMSASGGSSSGGDGNYRVLRQRDAEAGRMDNELSSNASSSDGELSQLSSRSSSVDDLFANETERRTWRQKLPERSQRSKRKVGRGRLKVSAAHFPFHSNVVKIIFKYSNQFSLD
ncbi:hypothetical protein KR215_001367, partial [Drosophila sulfurigaster]